MSTSSAPSSGHRRTLLALGAAATLTGATAAALTYRRGRTQRRTQHPTEGLEELEKQGLEGVDGLGWGPLAQPQQIDVPTEDGAHLAVWDVGSGPTVVLPHCWGCSHAIWVPVARRLVDSGHRVVLYDQRGHGATTRGTAPLDLVTLANDLAAVLEARDVSDAVLAGHSMGGMTIMALATFRPEVLVQQARAIVLVATAAADMSMGSARADRLASQVIGSPLVSRTLRSSSGHRFVRGVFGTDPVAAHMDLTRTLFADCDPRVRAEFLTSLSAMNLLEGIASIAVPTTVLIGSRDRLTPPARSQKMVDTIPGARLVTLQGRGHMLPLEDPDAVADEIARSAKG